MRVTPTIKVQSLTECDPGQLVRSLEGGQWDRLGLVVDTEDRGEPLRGIVSLNEDMPYFLGDQDAENVQVMLFEGETVWELDHSSIPNDASRNHFSKVGAVIADKDGQFLNVAMQDSRYGTRPDWPLNLSNAALSPYRERLRNSTTFTAWSVYCLTSAPLGQI